MHSPYVNYDAIRAMSDAELDEAMDADAMPYDLAVALSLEHHARHSSRTSFREHWPEYCIGLGALLFALWLVLVSVWA